MRLRRFTKGETALLVLACACAIGLGWNLLFLPPTEDARRRTTRLIEIINSNDWDQIDGFLAPDFDPQTSLSSLPRSARNMFRKLAPNRDAMVEALRTVDLGLRLRSSQAELQANGTIRVNAEIQLREISLGGMVPSETAENMKEQRSRIEVQLIWRAIDGVMKLQSIDVDSERSLLHQLP